jgi:DNA polymerase-1
VTEFSYGNTRKEPLPDDKVNYEVIRTSEGVRRAVDELSSSFVLAVDTESSGLDPYCYKDILLQIGTSSKCFVFDLFIKEMDLSPVKELLENEKYIKVLHNAKFDYKWLKVKHGISMKNIYCTMIAEKLLTVGKMGVPQMASLAYLVSKYMGMEMSKKARSGFIDRDPIADPITDREYEYSAKDVVLLPDIYYQQCLERDSENLKNVFNLEMRAVSCFAEMELAGCVLDVDRWKKTLEKAVLQEKKLQKEIFKSFKAVVSQNNLFGLPPFNLGSQQQLLKHLNKLGSSLEKKKQFKIKDTKEETLSKNKGKHEVFGQLVRLRGYQKIVSSYGDSILSKINKKTGRLHANFNQVKAATGRASSSKPNLQQVPGYDDEDPDSLDFRSCFITTKGKKLITADFSQQELRILADVSKDKTFYKAYTEKDKNGHELDVHKYTAAQVFSVPYEDVTPNQRKKAKCVHPGTLLGVEEHGEFKFRTIQDSANFSKQHDSFQDCLPGINVLNQYGGLTEVKQTYNGGLKKLLVVTSRYGVVVCSENHRFLLKDGRVVRSADLQETDVLSDIRPRSIYQRRYPTISYKMHRDLPELSFTPTDDTAYFAGVFLGDGSASADHAEICIGDITKSNKEGEMEYKEWFDSLTESLNKAGLNPKIAPNNELVNIGSRQVMKFLRALSLAKTEEAYEEGKRTWIPSEGKYSCRILRTPNWILEAGYTAVLNMLGGLIDTDGWVTKRGGQIALCTKDPVFAGQIVALANSCGIKTSSEPSYNSIHKKYYWKVHFSKSSNELLGKYIRHPRKKSLIQYTDRNSPNRDNRVLNVSKYSEAPSLCLDLSIDSVDHIYSTNGIFTHNTLNFFLVYGGGAFSLAARLKITEEEAQTIIDDYFKRYSSIKRCLDLAGNNALNKGYSVTTLGRKRFLPLMPTDHPDFDKVKKKQRRRGQNCVDDKTEALTIDRGWVKGFELNKDDTILTKNPDTGELEWQRMVDLKLFPKQKGDYYRIKSKSFDVITTGNHRWLVTNKSTGRSECKTTADISIHGDHRIHRTGKYKAPEGALFADEFVAVCGWFLTDGYIYNRPLARGTRPVVHLCQSNRANKDKVDEIRRTLQFFKNRYWEKSPDPRTENITWGMDKELSKYITTELPARELTMEFLLKLTGKQLNLLFEIMIKGDGTVNAGTGQEVFTTGSRQAAEMFQILCTMVGRASNSYERDFSSYVLKSDKMNNIPNTKKCWYVNVHKRDKVQVLKGQKIKLPEDEEVAVWCPSVPNTYFVARREGQVFVTGNTIIQGGGADVTKLAMVHLNQAIEERGFNAKLIMVIHDEFVVECDEDQAEEVAAVVEECMVRGFTDIYKGIPMVVDAHIGDVWAK